MIVDRRTLDHFLRAVSYLAREYDYIESDKFSITIYDLYLDEGLYRFIKNINKYRNEILDSVPKTYRRKIEKLIDVFSRNIDKSRKIILNPPDWLKNIVINHFLSKIYNGIDEYKLYDENINEIINLLPTEGYFKYKGKEFDGAILYPTKKELSLINDPPRPYTVITTLLHKNIRYNPETLSVELFGNKFYLDLKTFIEALDITSRSDIVNMLLENELRKILENTKYNDIEFKFDHYGSYTNLYINLSKEHLLKHFRDNEELMKEVEKGEISIKFESYRNPFVYSGRITYKHPLFEFTYHAHTSTLLEKAEYPSFKYMYYESTGVPLEKIPEAIDNLTKQAAEIIKDSIRTILKLRKTSLQHGFSYEPDTWTTNNIGVTCRKSSERTDIMIRYTKEFGTSMNEGIFVSISFDRGHRKITDDDIRYFLMKNGVQYDKVRQYGKTIEVVRRFDPDKVEEAFKYGLLVQDLLTKYYDQYVMETKKKQRTLKLSTEHYVAIYWINTSWKTSYNIDVEETTGRPDIVIYSTVARVLSKVSPEKMSKLKETARKQKEKNYIKEYSSEIIAELIKKNYISVNGNAELYINGKRLMYLLTEIGMLPTIAESIEKTLLLEAIDCIINMERAENEDIIDALAKKNLLTPSILQHIITSNSYYIHPESLVKEINGKTVWDMLPVPVKKTYLDSLSIYSLADIVMDNNLLHVYRDFKKYILERVLKEGSPSIVTRITVEKMPNIINLPRTVKPYEEGDFYGINAGMYVVQVKQVDIPSSIGMKKFIVYRKDTKLGVEVEGRNIQDALRNAMDIYDDVYKEYMKLKELETQLRRKGVFIYETKETGSEFFTVEIITRENRYPLTQGILEKILQTTTEKEEEEVSVGW